MPVFQYVARQFPDKEVRGTITAATEQEAVRQLVQQSLAPLRVELVKPVRKFRTGKIPASQLAAMYSQLSDLLSGGVPLLRSLEILHEQQAHAGLAAIIDEVRQQVANGTTLAGAMQQHPGVFGDLANSIVRAGEEGGFLEEALMRIATFLEREEDVKSRVLGALAYPTFLIVVGVIVVTILIVFFVPNFAPVFDRMREEGQLPGPTIVLLGISDFLRSHGLIVLGVLLGGGWLVRRHLRSELGRCWLDRQRLRIKWLGPVVRSFAIARFCRVLGTLLRNGVPILVSLRIAKEAIGNRVLMAAIEEAADSISKGNSLAQPLKSSGEFPPEIVELISVGEKANSLERVLLELADNLERRSNRRLDLLVRLLEPALLLVMACAILFVVLALLLPVFQMSTSLA